MNGLCSGRMADIDTLYIQLSKAWVLPLVMENDALFVVKSYRGLALQKGGIWPNWLRISIHTAARVVTAVKGTIGNGYTFQSTPPQRW